MSGVINSFGSKSGVIGGYPTGTVVNTTYSANTSHTNTHTASSANAYIDPLSMTVTAKATNSHYILHYKCPVVFVREGVGGTWAMMSVYYGTSGSPYDTELYGTTNGNRHEMGMTVDKTTSDYRYIFNGIIKDTASLAKGATRGYGLRLFNYAASMKVGFESVFDPQAVVYEVAT
jgi:hypothetical protein